MVEYLALDARGTEFKSFSLQNHFIDLLSPASESQYD